MDITDIGFSKTIYLIRNFFKVLLNLLGQSKNKLKKLVNIFINKEK